ncbi:MAG: DUF4275 family protein [Ruminococcaceae bacterium]|nr:DUF4275 family protein [Oscillospiraceae bacterium]
MTKKEFYDKWIETFAADIPEQDIQKYVKSTGNLIWHIFSWELLDEGRYFIGEKAKAAYDQIDKEGAICIAWFEDEHTKDIVADLNIAAALDDFVEIYVVGKNFEWTYIKTHESMCGPYFMSDK